MSNHAKQRWKERFGDGGEYGHVLRRSVRIGCVDGAEVRYYAPLKCVLVVANNVVLTVVKCNDSERKYKTLVRRYHYQVEKAQLSQLLDFPGLLKSSL